jgi:hypothetical protein
MTDDPIAVLERELVGAARRRAGGPARRYRPTLNGIAAAVLVAVTVAVGAGALILLGGHKRPATTPAAAVPGRQQLIDILGVLRRPQRKADRPPWLQRSLRPVLVAPVPHGTAELSLARYATTTPWGERLYFVPIKPPTAKQLAVLAHRYPQIIRNLLPPSRQVEMLGVFSRQSGSGGGSVADIEAGNDLQVEGAGRGFAGGSTQSRLIVVVPDGVARVEFVLPRQSSPSSFGGPVYAQSLSVSVPVHGNVGAVQVDRECCNGAPPMIWYGADGHVIKRIGNFATTNRVVQQPRPAPETPLSLAAGRNPSTPNPVWVTPSVGGPHTAFKLHFRLLLNGADYTYHLSGTSCPTITVNGGSGGGSTDLRGRIWSDIVDAVQGQTWCPGTYHLSATVMDLGRHGQLRHPAKPFGTATFTVHR